MIIEVILMVCLIIIQLMIGHLWHQIGWSYTKAILLMCWDRIIFDAIILL